MRAWRESALLLVMLAVLLGIVWMAGERKYDRCVTAATAVVSADGKPVARDDPVVQSQVADCRRFPLTDGPHNHRFPIVP